jgi:pimeloyl-ACP methyl ester carboxylesterase
VSSGSFDTFGEPRTIHWLGGWASSLDCWEPQLRARFPGYDHRFVDTHAVLTATPAQAGLTGPQSQAQPGDIVAAWSLGSLRAHRWIEAGEWPGELSLLSLCPVFRFVQPAAFGESVLLRMEQKLGVEREAVLRDFWKRMPKAAAMPPEWEENWIAGTRRYGDAEILQALQYLRLEVVDMEGGALRGSSGIVLPRAWELIAGARDRLAPVGEWKNALPEGARLHVYDGGHIPFWECPDLMEKSLYRLSHDY